MFTGMNQQEQDFLTNLQSSEATMRAEIQQMKQVMDQMKAGAMAGGAAGKGGDWHQGTGAWESGGFPRVMLGEKHFRRVDKFEGNPAKFKSRTFDLITAVGSVDLSLAKDLKEQLKARPKIETDEGVFKIPADVLIDENHERYIEKQSHKFVKKPGSLAKS